LSSLLNFKLTCSLTFKDKFSCQKLVLIQILIMCAVLLLSRPFVSALHGVSCAPGMCVSTVKIWDIGEKTVRSSTEPARIQLQQHILNEAPNLSADTVNDKYFIDSACHKYQ
jgi:membrane protein required for beta-lactamase induction